MVLAVISEHLVGTRYYLFFFFFKYTFSPFLTTTLQKRPSAEGDTEAEAPQVTELETTPQEPNQGRRCLSQMPCCRSGSQSRLQGDTGPTVSHALLLLPLPASLFMLI